MVQGDTAWSILDPVCNLWEICSNILSRRKRQNIYFSTASHPNSRFEDRSSAPTILLNDFQNRFKSSMHFNCGSNPSVIMRVDHSVTQTVDLHLHQARIVLSKNIDWLLHSFTLPTVDLENQTMAGGEPWTSTRHHGCVQCLENITRTLDCSETPDYFRQEGKDIYNNLVQKTDWKSTEKSPTPL